jgi:hypothetical protein
MASITEPFRGDDDHTSLGYSGGMERESKSRFCFIDWLLLA